jgi:hypothetical protein
MLFRIAASTALALASATAAGQAKPEGFLCCNMRTDGSWISDINYIGSGKQIVPVGTPVRVTGYGRYRVLVDIGGKPQALGNDYSREVKLEDFAQRYVLAKDPSLELERFAPKVREAIKSARIMRGMTRAQVLMAVGYPIGSENPDLQSNLWRYWISRSAEYQVFWGDDGRVEKIFGSPETRAQVVLE